MKNLLLVFLCLFASNLSANQAVPTAPQECPCGCKCGPDCDCGCQHGQRCYCGEISK